MTLERRTVKEAASSTETVAAAGVTWWSRSRERLEPYVFVAPFFLVYGFFYLYPVLSAFILNFTDWKGADPPRWVGLANWKWLFQEPDFYKSLANSAWYMVVGMGIGVPLALLLAIMLNQTWLRLRPLYRTIFFLPVVTSPIAIGLVFNGVLFGRYFGVLNQVLRQLGLQPIMWLDMPELAKPAVILLGIWHALPINILYFLAGLQAIPQELYDAAAIDGANMARQFRHVTVPMLRPVLLFILITGTSGSLQIFDTIMAIFGGSTTYGIGAGPKNAAITLPYLIYRTGFYLVHMGRAATVGVFLFLLIGLLAAIQVRRFGMFREEY